MSAIKPETKRKRIREDIAKMLEEAGNASPTYISKLDEYMELYDHSIILEDAAESMAKNVELVRSYMEVLRELRQVRKSMRDTLDWMGISANKDRQPDYEL